MCRGVRQPQGPARTVSTAPRAGQRFWRPPRPPSRSPPKPDQQPPPPASPSAGSCAAEPKAQDSASSPSRARNHRLQHSYLERAARCQESPCATEVISVAISWMVCVAVLLLLATLSARLGLCATTHLVLGDVVPDGQQVWWPLTVMVTMPSSSYGVQPLAKKRSGKITMAKRLDRMPWSILRRKLSPIFSSIEWSHTESPAASSAAASGAATNSLPSLAWETNRSNTWAPAGWSGAGGVSGASWRMALSGPLSRITGSDPREGLDGNAGADGATVATEIQSH